MASPPPPRLLNFISEQQLEEVRQKRGPRVEDGAVAVEKPLFEILKENKEKHQEEFNDRFKHRPPKALDEEETEFLENLETHKKEQEKQLADEEARQLVNFKAAVANRTIKIEEPKALLQTEEQPKLVVREKKPTQTRYLSSLLRVKPQAKKVKLEDTSVASQGTYEGTTASSFMYTNKEHKVNQEKTEKAVRLVGLVSYDDDSDND